MLNLDSLWLFIRYSDGGTVLCAMEDKVTLSYRMPSLLVSISCVFISNNLMGSCKRDFFLLVDLSLISVESLFLGHLCVVLKVHTLYNPHYNQHL